MKKEELRADIEEMLMDVEFSYKGIDGSICPFSRGKIGIMYDGKEDTVHSVDELMEKPFIAGYSLEEVCEKIKIY